LLFVAKELEEEEESRRYHTSKLCFNVINNK